MPGTETAARPGGGAPRRDRARATAGRGASARDPAGACRGRAQGDRPRAAAPVRARSRSCSSILWASRRGATRIRRRRWSPTCSAWPTISRRSPIGMAWKKSRRSVMRSWRPPTCCSRMPIRSWPRSAAPMIWWLAARAARATGASGRAFISARWSPGSWGGRNSASTCGATPSTWRRAFHARTSRMLSTCRRTPSRGCATAVGFWRWGRCRSRARASLRCIGAKRLLGER